MSEIKTWRERLEDSTCEPWEVKGAMQAEIDDLRTENAELKAHKNLISQKTSAGFPQKIMDLLLEMADRIGTENYGPWEDGNGEPLQDDAEAAISWIYERM